MLLAVASTLHRRNLSVSRAHIQFGPLLNHISRQSSSLLFHLELMQLFYCFPPLTLNNPLGRNKAGNETMPLTFWFFLLEQAAKKDHNWCRGRRCNTQNVPVDLIYLISSASVFVYYF